ncbi:hypothetical protein BN1080_01688 [Planococcus massiliensis]|uniref:Uncharacterized protein n=1 Tax=Planococcus massiliensis TaxID=1499687 RepID=A0A098EKA4_9BACL|nr:hypothetical protein [Planococcus massiliensis]CEG22753.1 hypothetical protein BN1080_01688 [Planococcus massiliensis]
MVQDLKERMGCMTSNALLFAGIAGVLTLILIVSNTPNSALIVTNGLLGLIAGQLMIRNQQKN